MSTTLLLSTFLYIDYSADEPKIATRLLPMIFVTLGFGIVGFVDKEIKNNYSKNSISGIYTYDIKTPYLVNVSFGTSESKEILPSFQE